MCRNNLIYGSNSSSKANSTSQIPAQPKNPPQCGSGQIGKSLILLIFHIFYLSVYDFILKVQQFLFSFSGMLFFSKNTIILINLFSFNWLPLIVCEIAGSKQHFDTCFIWISTYLCTEIGFGKEPQQLLAAAPSFYPHESMSV